MNKIISGEEKTNGHMNRKPSGMSLDSSEKSDDYFDEDCSVGSNMYLAS